VASSLQAGIGKVKGKVVPVFNYVPHCENVWGVEVQLHAFFDLGTRWR
jgi:hypothetical protein